MFMAFLYVRLPLNFMIVDIFGKNKVKLYVVKSPNNSVHFYHCKKHAHTDFDMLVCMVKKAHPLTSKYFVEFIPVEIPLLYVVGHGNISLEKYS